jgi:hypothetical protein
LLRAAVYTSSAIDALGLIDHIGPTCIDKNRFNRTYRLADTALVAEMNLKIALWKTGHDTYASRLVCVELEVLSRARELTQTASCTPFGSYDDLLHATPYPCHDNVIRPDYSKMV